MLKFFLPYSGDYILGEKKKNYFKMSSAEIFTRHDKC